MRKALSTLICLLFCIICYADNHYYLKNLSIQNGLSQSTVNAILQDRKGFMWFGTKDGLNRYDGLSFRQFKHSEGNEGSLGNNFITALHEDKEGNIWIGTDAGLYIYYPEKDMFAHFDQKSTGNTMIFKSVNMITEDDSGSIWIAVDSQGLFCYNLHHQALTHYDLSKNTPSVTASVTSIAFDNSGTIWVGLYGGGLLCSKDQMKSLKPYCSQNGKQVFSHDDVIPQIVKGAYNCMYVGSFKKGVKEINLTSGHIRDLLLTDEKGESIFCRQLLFYSDDELWIGTESGIYIYTLRTGKYIHLSSSPYDKYALSDNAVYSIYKDREKGMWIGSYFGGIDYYPHPCTYFEKYYSNQQPNSLRGKRVREFCSDYNGNIWIGTEDGGLNRFNPQTKEFFFLEASTAFTNIHGLCMDGENLWVGTFSKGLRVIDTRTGKVLKTYMSDNKPGSLNDNNIFAICRTASGNMYLGTIFGLLRYNRESDTFEQIPELDRVFVYDIKEDSYGNLWLATYANGAYCYNVNKKKWKNYVHDNNKPNSLPYNKVLSVYEDSRRRLWLTTQGGGFCQFHPETETFTCYDLNDGLPNEVVYQIVEDNDGLLWLTTNNGLVCFHPVSKAIKVYTTANGLLGDQFSYRSSHIEEDGTIYLGSIDGFITFNPKTFTENKYIPPIAITDFLLFSKEVRVGESGSPLEKSITFSEKIELKSNQNSFSFRIAALSFMAPQMNKLMYRLDGFDKEWLTISESPLITYSNLEYGKYVFRVKASNSNGIWNEEELALNIYILPPFYLTVWAYLFYTLLFIGCSAYSVFYIRRKNGERQQRQTEKFEQEKEREIYHAKIEFFTTVAHEIRTPLTLIKGPLENIILKKAVDTETNEDLHIMKQNTERLLNLTNQLLDFRKTERQGYRLHFTNCNITEVVQETFTRFTSLAKQRELDFALHLPETEISAHVNKEAFIKIISNLLNNAVKYASTYIHASMEMELLDQKPVFHFRIVNDGPIIPDEMKEEIFKPFVRFGENENGNVTTGTGIGLALSRSLTELHQGSLVMLKGETENVFYLSLPGIQDTTIKLASEPIIKESSVVEHRTEPVEHRENKPTVLVVDDNPEMLSFVSRQLSNDYNVLTATNGSQALHVLDVNFVNLVLSDVVMPKMGGFELCQAIKSKLDYSHIPVILLTAKTNIQSKIEGMEQGADAYIEKPFSMEYLYACVSNLINNREKLRKAFAQSPFVAVNTMALTKADEEFIKKLNDIILGNLHNPEFSMDDMAEALNMSRSNFYRKIKGVLDLTPNDYLRLERLKRAAQLLKEGESRVNEISYTVGFNSPSYFTKCFHKQFGVLPKDFEGYSS